MNRQQFLSFMQSPDKLNGESVSLLADVVSQFPYCQTAQLLYLKNLHLHKSIHYNQQLKIAATYSSDRKKLYELVIQPGITSKIKKIEGSSLEHSDLEREILKEAINASIQLEVAQSKPKTRTPAKNEIASPKKPSRTTGKSNIQKGERTFGDWLKIINKEGQIDDIDPKLGKTIKGVIYNRSGEEFSFFTGICTSYDRPLWHYAFPRSPVSLDAGGVVPSIRTKLGISARREQQIPRIPGHQSQR